MNLFVSEPGSKIRIDGGRLCVDRAAAAVMDFPKESIDSLTVFTGASVTGEVIRDFSENGRPIFWCDMTGKTYAALTPATAENVARRKRQMLLSDVMPFRVAMAQRFTFGKILNQYAVLKELDGDTAAGLFAQAIADKASVMKNATDLQTVMGVEGYAAKCYFAVLSAYLPPELGFEKRTRRPPRDPFSALLGYLYMLLYHDMVNAISCAGLDPYVGVMHELRAGHCALASDLMEEFRPVLCDRTALLLVLRGDITRDDFRFNDDGSVYLSREGAKKAIALYEETAESYSGFKRQNGIGNDLRSKFAVQVRQLIKVMEDMDPNEYTVFSMDEEESEA